MYKVKRFSSLTSTDDTKLKLGDRMDIWSYKNLMGDKGRSRERERIEGVDTSKRDAKVGAISGGIHGALIGGSLGYLTKGKKGASIGSAIGGAAGAGIGSASAYVGSKAGQAARKQLEKNETYKKSWEKLGNKLDVAEGKMSKSDFAKKWYKD